MSLTLPVCLKDHPVIRQINRFLLHPGYVLGICLLAFLSNAFSLELPVYTVFVATAVYICLLGDDLLPLMPLVACSYIATSIRNNPGSNENTVYSIPGPGVYLAVLAALFVLCLVWRVATDPHFGGRSFFRAKRRLLPGMIALGAAYLLGGIFSPAYPGLGGKGVLFGLLQALTILLPYYLFSGGVRWERAPRDYFAWMGFGIGLALLGQLLWIFQSGSVIQEGIIDRERIFTGWGMHNNLGVMLAMMIPFAFYLASRYHKGWLGTVVGSGLLLGVFMTCSRSSILVGTAIYLVCGLLMLLSAKNRRGNTVALVVILGAMAVGLLLFHQQIILLFKEILDRGLDPNYRDKIYDAGLKQFAKYPLFGGSFYPIDYVPYDWSVVEGFSSFFPPRWHNTVVQLLASTGVVGLIAYGFHRVQTLWLLVKRRSWEAIFIACSVAVLLGCSLFDCHFFNIGPVLFYAMGLAFGEHRSKKKIS